MSKIIEYFRKIYQNPRILIKSYDFPENLQKPQTHCEFTVECKLHPGGIEPQPIKLEFKIYPAELWIWVHWCMICCWNLLKLWKLRLSIANLRLGAKWI